MVYIYGLISSEYPDVVRYVGKSNNPRKRYKRHLSASYMAADTHKNRWIKKELSNGHTINFKILEEVSEENWEECEKLWISKLSNLTNSTSGGEGISPTDDIVARRGKTRKENNLKDKAEEIKRFNINELGGRWYGERSCPKCSETVSYNTSSMTKTLNLIRKSLERNCYSCTRYICNKNKGTKDFGKIGKLRSKKIEQYTLDGKFVASYDSIGEATRLTNINHKSISNCAKGGKWQNQAGGYIFKFKEQTHETNIPH